MTTNPTDSAGAVIARQTWDPASYAKSARFVSVLGTPVLDLLAPQNGERILDLGCGDGVLTKTIAEAGAQVLGIDSSAEQVAAACDKGIDARLLSGAELDFNKEFDAVFSNAALHWIADQDALLEGVWDALKIRGRFVAEMGGAGNVASVRGSLYNALARRGIEPTVFDPWYFPDAQEYRQRLESAGFSVERIALIDRPTAIPGSLADWLDVFARSFLGAVEADERDALKDEVQDAVATKLYDGGQWTVDYVRLRFNAFKTGG
ncbi:MAG: methyltransferase domain-containing protein [Pseudomonadota bacterium]|nr:methyltransferase domain-containing protein [Pseudomonadota bacterium]